MVDKIHGVLGASDVVLKKSIPEPRVREFFPTEIEWILRNRQGFHEGAVGTFAGTGTTVLQTNTENQILYITNIYINMIVMLASTTTNNGRVELCVISRSASGSGSEEIMCARIPVDVIGHDHIPISFKLPFLISSGDELIVITSESNTGNSEFIVTAEVFGWIEPKKIIPL